MTELTEPQTDYRRRIYERYASSVGRGGDVSGCLPYYEKLTQHLPDAQARLLELGAGAGGFLSFLAARGFTNLHGIDGSPEQVAIAEQQGAPVELGDALETLRATPTATYEVVVALDVVEHFSKQEAFTLLSEAHRVLVPGGRFLIHTVNADSPFFGTIRYGDFTHETAFNRESMTQVLKTIGFDLVVCHEDRPVVHGLKSFVRAGIWQVARGMATVVLAAETGVLGGRILSQNFLTVATK